MPGRHSPALPALLLVLVISWAAACGEDMAAPPPSSPNQRPVATSTIPAQELAAGDTLTVEASSYFSDPDGDVLTFEAATSNAGFVEVSLTGSSVAVVGVAPGEARITIRARDPRGLQALLEFSVLVPTPRTEDHAPLVAFYEATGGPNWSANDNWLTPRPLEVWHGVEVDGEGRVVGLNLELNRLTGQLPPELRALSRLQTIVLPRNELTGGIPPELGGLPDLRRLDLRDNRIGDEIPPALGDIAYLDELDLRGNQLEGAIPAALGNLGSLRRLYLSENDLTGEIPSDLGNLDRLERLYLTDNDLAGEIPPALGDLTGLRQLYVGDNGLTGEIPPTLGDLASLRHLVLFGNALVGPVPPELGRLTQLRLLNLRDNPGLSGALPSEVTSLFRMRELLLQGTGLCAPLEPTFRNWLDGIWKHRVSPCGGEGFPVYLTQAVQSTEFPVPLVAGDSALLRVFPTAPDGAVVDFPPVNARFYLDGVEEYSVDIPAQANPVPTEFDESSLAVSANAVVPARVVQPGLEMVVEVDPDGTVDPALGLTQRIPASGRRPVDVREMPTFDLTLIPFLREGSQDRSIVAFVEGLTPDHEFLWMTRTLLPIGDFVLSVHEPVTASTNNQNELLGLTSTIRVMEGASGYYMGTMTGSDGGGLAYLGGRSSFADMREDILAHELGHNLSLEHAPCSAPGPDPWFPQPNGTIGAWGYDFRDGDQLIPPDTPDIMSYCHPPWISDYYFGNALRHRLRVERVEAAAPGRTVAAGDRTLLLWGGIDETGAPYLEPAFVLDAPPTQPRSAGPYELRGRTATGEQLFSLTFAMPEVADGDGRSSFAFALPVQSGWAGELASITLSGPPGSYTLDAESDRAVAIVRDPATGQIRGIFRDLPPDALAAASLAQGVAEALSLDPGLEVLVSRGIPVPADWNR